MYPVEMGRPLQALLQHRAVQGNFDHYYEGVEIAFDAKRNLAHVADAATASPRLVEHSKRMAQRVYRVAERVYCAVLQQRLERAAHLYGIHAIFL